MKSIFFKRPSIYLTLFLIVAIHVFILTKLIYFPYPELFIYPYLTNHGLAPYVQILDQHFPGLLFLPINLNNLGMNTPETARIWSIAVVILIQVILFFVSSEILKSKTKALLVNILYLIWQPFFEGWVLWIDSFLPLLLLPALYSLYRGKIFAAGILLGLAVMFKQTIIPLSVFVLIYIFWKTRSFKNSFRFLGGLLIPVVLMVVYLASIGVFSDFWYWTVTFNLTTFAQFGRGAVPTLAHFLRVLFVFGLPFLILKWIRLAEVQILLIFLIGALAGLSTRFDFVHFQPALPFALIAFVFVLGRLGKLGRLGIMSLYGLILVWWLIIFYKGHLGDQVISFGPNTRELAVKIKSSTSPGEKIFIYGVQQHLYQMSDTLPAGDIFVFQFPWFMQVAESRILEGIIKDKPRIVISDREVLIENRKITDFARDIDQYIQSNYQKIDSVGTAEILQRK
ncbi:MAG: glycosyltransferase family 39 protein [Candidatus Daviesbacteria bacterium]|nr:glycosyltransferase family 39 protein [Candidatus Daviesbacteria bacterium]